MGNLAAEYGGTSATHGPEFLTADHLGSTRVLTNAAQGIVSRHDFRPFGDEIPGTGIRQGITGYNQDGGVRQEFTSKERDAETGLDFFGARYFSGAQGRFTSTDPIAMTREKLKDPQQLNMYAYARNNPLAYVDPKGETVNLSNLSDKIPEIDLGLVFYHEAIAHGLKDLGDVGSLFGSNALLVTQIVADELRLPSPITHDPEKKGDRYFLRVGYPYNPNWNWFQRMWNGRDSKDVDITDALKPR